jgi:4-hydroxy-tetrahydrodipicolinate synthase
VRLHGAGAKPIRGVFPIMATPFTESKAVDYEDLEREVDFLDRCGVHGMVWPQLASEYWLLTKEERFRGMELLARRCAGGVRR